MLVQEVVTVGEAVAATRARTVKAALLADLLARVDPSDLPAVVAWTAGETLQGRIGVGMRTLADVRGPASAIPTLTVAEVDAALTALTTTTGAGSVGVRKAVLNDLMSRATTAEQDFLVRLITGEIRLGALEGVMTDAIAAAAQVPVTAVRRAVMLSGRLPETAVAAMAGGAQALAKMGLRVGRPVRPMLASPGESVAAAHADLKGDLSVEFKLDGARIQVHRDGTDVAVFTRTLREITGSVPELVELVRELPCRSTVLDGETLALTDSGRPRPFQETMSRFGATSERSLVLSPYFFDCLELDGEDLLDQPLTRRQEALGAVAGPHRIPTLLRPTVTEVDEHLVRALAAGHEGIMLKALDSPYAAGRRGKSWQKIKPEHTLDLIVLGAEWGYGRRTGWLSNLHLGARDPDGGEPIMVGKTFKGLTDEVLRWQTETFPQYERSRDGAAVYLRPEIVVEIELDGVQRSTRYPGGVALRFARVLRYRPDREAADASTIDDVRALLIGRDQTPATPKA